MLSSADAPRSKPTLRRKSSSFSDADASSVVIKEIRSSLFLATSIIEDGVPDEDFLICDGNNCKRTVYFECGRLKYSHVKGEWSILHRPLRAHEGNKQKSGADKSPIAMVIASLRSISAQKQSIPPIEKRTKKNFRNKHKSQSSTGAESRQPSRNRRKLSGDDDGIGNYVDVHFRTTHNDEVCDVIRSATIGSMLSSSTPTGYLEEHPISPAIDLVRYLLNGAEFISMMKCARWEVESSIRKIKDDIGVNGRRMNKTKIKGKHFDDRPSFYSKARFWSRRMTKNLKQRSINLQPMIVALVASTIGTNSPPSKPSPLSSLNSARTNDCNFNASSLETIMLKFLDECIRFAHLHTLDLIAHWSPCWQVHASLRSEKVDSIVDAENLSSSIADNTSSTTCTFMSKLVQNGNKKYDGDNKSNIEAISFEAITTIHEFVRACLGNPREDILQSNPNIASLNGNASKDCSDVSYRRALSEVSKRGITSRRSKVFTREPADSLVATGMKRNQNIVSSATKQTPTYAKKDSLLENQRHKRMKSSRHISPSSVLENTATVILQKNGRSIRTTRSDSVNNRKLSDSLPPQIIRNQCKKIEKYGSMKKEHDTHNIGFHNKSELRSEMEKMSPNSLYQFFEKRRKINEIPGEIFDMDDNDKQTGDSIIHASPPKQHESKYLNRMPNPGTTSQSDGISNMSLMRLESRLDKNCIDLFGKGIKNQAKWNYDEMQRNNPVDSLYSISKASPPFPAFDLSLGVTSTGSKTSGESLIRNSSDDSAVNPYYVESQGQRKKLNAPELKVEEHLEAAKAFFHEGLIKVKEEPKDDASSQNAIISQDIAHDEKHHDNEESLKESRQHWNILDQVSADDILNQGISDLKGDFKAPESSTGLPWVILSHIGHISDYHGYKRKYEHFAPLQFGPVADIRRQIERTLIENEDGIGGESDEDVINENRSYEQAIDQYKILAEKERSFKKKYKIGISPKTVKETSDDMLVVFSAPMIDDEIALPVDNLTTNKWNMKIFGADGSVGAQPPKTTFRIFDQDDIVLNTAEDKGETKRKRKSRSAQIAHQKKTSNRMLNEMLHTLDFIEKYNRKSKGTMQEKIVEVQREIVDTGDIDENSSTQKDKSNTTRCSRKVQGDQSLANNNLEISAMPPFATLSTGALLQSHVTLRKQFSLFHSLNRNDDIEAMKEEIRNILDNASLLDEFFRNDEIIAEEKTLARCIRRYSSKADQEKIEKREFEERQKLRQHEFEYYCRLKKKKKSPQEIEWKEISARPIYYVRSITSLLNRADVCNFKPNCKICDPTTLDNKLCDSTLTIFSPRFRRAESNTLCIPYGTGPDDDSAWNDISNFVPPSQGQKLFSWLKLAELYHSLDFIKNYNDGMIVSRKRRK